MSAYLITKKDCEVLDLPVYEAGESEEVVMVSRVRSRLSSMSTMQTG